MKLSQEQQLRGANNIFPGMGVMPPLPPWIYAYVQDPNYNGVTAEICS